MNDSQTGREGLVWKDKYSVKVKEIDDQHKQLFEIINSLIQVITHTPNEGEVKTIIEKIIAYKAIHFATEEKYFHQFNFSGAQEHEARHKEFNQKVEEIQKQYEGDTVGFAFALVDFLEDWLINHLMFTDQQYVTCFTEHGLH